MAGRGVWTLFCAGVLGLLAAAVPGAAAGDAQANKLAIVNVSFLFEKYDRVPDIQRRSDEKHKGTRNELEQRGQELEKRNRELEQFAAQKISDERVFEMIQKLRKDQFYFERDLNRMNEEIQREYTKEMRTVLSDIRTMVRVVAEEKNFLLVVRSPSTDDPVVTPATGRPDEGDNRTMLEMMEPKTAGQLVERFNRNPVLFGSDATDITQEVLKRLNDQYRKAAVPAPK